VDNLCDIDLNFYTIFLVVLTDMLPNVTVCITANVRCIYDKMLVWTGNLIHLGHVPKRFRTTQIFILHLYFTVSFLSRSKLHVFRRQIIMITY
jgi:hypothetical protein